MLNKIIQQYLLGCYISNQRQNIEKSVYIQKYVVSMDGYVHHLTN